MQTGDGTDFSQAVLAEAKQEADEIIDLARREADRILDGAREELEQICVAESPQTATQKAKTRHKHIVTAAEFEARKQEFLAQEKLIVEVQEQVKKRLLRIRDESLYPDLLAELIREGAAALASDGFEIIVAPEDRILVTDDLLSKLGQETGSSLTLSEQSRPGITGAIIQCVHKRVLCDNTLQGIFERQKSEIRSLIAQDLFEGIEL